MGNFVDFNQLEHMACNPSIVADYNDLVSSTSPAGQGSGYNSLGV